jgi:hypothetical protein
MKMRWKSAKRAPLASELAIGVGSLLLAWGYRRWRRRMKQGPAGGKGAEAGEPEAEPATQAQAKSLADKWKSLDEESFEGHIPEELERMPKGQE